jgi:hypothetical protein
LCTDIPLYCVNIEGIISFQVSPILALQGLPGERQQEKCQVVRHRQAVQCQAQLGHSQGAAESRPVFQLLPDLEPAAGVYILENTPLLPTPRGYPPISLWGNKLQEEQEEQKQCQRIGKIKVKSMLKLTN